ncbi:substrate-binding domain-containing protein [Streptomyces sp. NPDC058663]
MPGSDSSGRLRGRPAWSGSTTFRPSASCGLYKAGVRVPHDVAMVGYEDLVFAEAAMVPLTSARWPAHALGMRGGRLLIEHTAQEAHEHVHEVLTPELVVRRSTLSVAG